MKKLINYGLLIFAALLLASCNPQVLNAVSTTSARTSTSILHREAGYAKNGTAASLDECLKSCTQKGYSECSYDATYKDCFCK